MAAATVAAMTSHIARTAAVLAIATTAACSSTTSVRPVTLPAPAAPATAVSTPAATIPSITAPATAASTSPAASFPVTVTSCANAYLGKTTAAFSVRNATSAHVFVAIVVTINGSTAGHLVRADDRQPAFSPKGIGLDPNQTWTGSASLPAGSGTPTCAVEVRPQG